MSTRDLGEAGIKLIGAYFAASTLIGIMRVAASFALPRMEGFPSAGEVALLNALPIAGSLGVAVACLLRGQLLADRVFAVHRFKLAQVTRRDLLVVGLALLGVSTISAGVPGILQFIGRTMWYAEGSRQSMFFPSMERSWEPLANNVLELIVGGALVAMAGRLASALDARYGDTFGAHDPAS